jgi:hypothetical protein
MAPGSGRPLDCRQNQRPVGVEAVLIILADETRKALTLTGVTEMNRAHVVALE